MEGFWLGILGSVVGSAVTLAGQFAKHRWETGKSRLQNEKRKALLKQMLDKAGRDGWRKMETLSGVIGASREETAQLLIELDARSSESGTDVWAYVANQPLPEPSK
ncbi:hypothetical protein [Sphingopyxis sp. L1A2A]|uniref:hypothetical protein n=1 Tax=Sphingopyxis sp. L1A2A TaxID=2502247 RepID=UPI0010F6CAB7|nr:hypothetical protein [Sphingopyxis sp. L1A2A]